MYRLVFGKKFFVSAKKLNEPLKPKLKSCLDILSLNIFHPLLHAKPLTGKLSGFYSFRLGRDYRIIFKIIFSEEIFLIEIGDRKDIYK